MGHIASALFLYLISLSLASASTLVSRSADLSAKSLLGPLICKMKTDFAKNEMIQYVAEGSEASNGLSSIYDLFC